MVEPAATSNMVIRRANPDDLPLLITFIGELAAHEGRPELATIDAETLSALLFGERALGEAYIGELDGKAAAYAVVAERFTSFRGTRLLYIEDMLVRTEYRKGGTGKQMLAFLARRAQELGCQRMEWSALANNDIALGFYDHLGAERETGVVHFELSGDAYKKLQEYGDE